MKKYVYILVSQSGTTISKILKMFTRKPYNHVSVSCESDLSEMYSFCRNKPERPLPATFNKEIIGEGTLGKYNMIPCELYRISVTDEQKELLYKNIEHFKQNRDCYSYNCIGLGFMLFHIAFRRKNKFVCSQFVGYILEKSGINSQIHKPVCLQTPEDFRHIPDAELIYKGNLNNYHDYVDFVSGIFEQLPDRSSEKFQIPL